MSHYQPYTAEEDASLEAALNATDKTKKVLPQLQGWADANGRTINSVRVRLAELGLSHARVKPEPKPQKDATFEPGPRGGMLQRGKKAGDETISKAEAWTVHYTVKEMVKQARQKLNSEYGKDIGDLLAELMANVDNPGVQLQALKEFNDRAYGKPDAKISVQMGDVEPIFTAFADILAEKYGEDAVGVLEEVKTRLEKIAADADNA